ncbi:MAG: gfo/Idh/MocA family oxidoreductase [Leptolyngbya sp. PLA3]|nr:MAG: gfo/Idh/MocA family oxidoreductase [Cyanobacteria bacterium CYA]MCE7968042.1 gfo/Idh/MocA family oxidoreductase [Leptolyngbya sp. PL-A3]
MSTHTVGVGIIGLGFMGRTHLSAYQRAEADGLPCHIAGVCDQNAARLSGRAGGGGNLDSGAGEEQMFDPAKVFTTSDVDVLLGQKSVQLVSICTHTDTHVDLATRALRAGKHVLVEKPVALSVEAVDTLIEEAERAGRICMPAMCLRFWPGWSWLKEVVADRRYGRVVSARFERLGAAPAWGEGFYANTERSGGALFDLHVHDVDFVHYLFGQPRSLTAVGTPAHVTACFAFDGMPAQVVAEGGWLNSPKFPFRMRYIVEFERAVADFDLLRDPALFVYGPDASEAVTLPPGNGYDGEVRHAVELARGLVREPLASLGEARAVTRTILGERESLRTGKPVSFERL